MIPTTWHRFFLIVAIFCGSNLAWANSEQTLTLTQTSQSIAPIVHILRDSTKVLDANSIWAQQRDFSRNEKNQLSFEIDKGAYWIRFGLENPTESFAQRILDLDYSLTRRADLYIVEADKPALLQQVSLDDSAFSRNIIYRNPSFELNLPPQTQVDYLLRLEFSGKANHALETNPILHTTGTFILRQLVIHIFFAGFLAFLFSIAIYNIILSTKVGIKDHIYYSLYLSCYIFIVLFYEGFIFYFPTPPPVEWVIAGMTLLPIYASVSLMAFGRGILQLSRLYPRIDLFYKRVIFSLFILSPLTLFHVGWVNLVLELSGVAATLALGVLAIFVLKKGVKAAKYFAISFVFIALGYGIETSLYSLSTKSWFDDPKTTIVIGLFEQYFFYVCASIEMIFLSLALASYVDQLRRDKEQAQLDALAESEEINRLKSRYTKQLEHDIAERTREVTEKSLLLAEKNEKLREVDQLKSRFFANISHEFRTPLTLIRGPFHQMINGGYGKLNKSLREAALIGSRNSDRLGRLMDELLDLSRLEAGELKLDTGTHDINAFCKRVSSLFRHTSRERDIRFTHQTTDKKIFLDFDLKKMETVLVNLLSNAFKYTPAGGSVDLSVVTQYNSVAIKIKDNGSGIPKHERSHIFDRFYRTKSADANAIAGSGIGLALAKDLVELHEGKISVNPEVTKGSEFIVELPLATEHSNVSGSQSEDLPAVLPLPASTNDTEETNSDVENDAAHILLVEDNPDMRVFISSLFPSNYKITEATNGKIALEILEKKKVDLVVSDIMMPEMDGLTMLEKIRENEKLHHLPILLITARAADEDRIMALRASADDYMAKPFDAEELLIRVNNLLERFKTDSSNTADQYKETPSAAFELDSADQVFLNKARQLVIENIGNPDFNVNRLADALYVSKNTLYRRLESMGVKTPSAFIRNIRLEHAHHIIQSNNKRTMAEVAYEVGFSSPGYFSKLYRQYKSD